MDPRETATNGVGAIYGVKCATFLTVGTLCQHIDG